MTDERPAHYHYNAETGENERIEVSDEEWEKIKRGEEENDARIKAEQEQEEALREAVKNHPDPVVQALAKKAGIV